MDRHQPLYQTPDGECRPVASMTTDEIQACILQGYDLTPDSEDEVDLDELGEDIEECLWQELLRRDVMGSE